MRFRARSIGNWWLKILLLVIKTRIHDTHNCKLIITRLCPVKIFHEYIAPTTTTVGTLQLHQLQFSHTAADPTSQISRDTVIRLFLRSNMRRRASISSTAFHNFSRTRLPKIHLFQPRDTWKREPSHVSASSLAMYRVKFKRHCFGSARAIRRNFQQSKLSLARASWRHG